MGQGGAVPTGSASRCLSKSATDKFMQVYADPSGWTLVLSPGLKLWGSAVGVKNQQKDTRQIRKNVHLASAAQRQ